MDLAIVHHELVIDIQDALLSVAFNVGPISEVGGVFDDMCKQLQALGICHLMEFANLDEFHQNLTRSAHARRYYLWRSRSEGVTDDRFLALTRTESTLDAIAAGQVGLTRQIADYSIDAWRADWEYEDDYCYYALLHELIRRPQDFGAAPTRLLLNRFDHALEGAESPQRDACVALADRDVSALCEALERLCAAEEERNDAAREGIGDTKAMSRVCLECRPSSRSSRRGPATP